MDSLALDKHCGDGESGESHLEGAPVGLSESEYTGSTDGVGIISSLLCLGIETFHSDDILDTVARYLCRN